MNESLYTGTAGRTPAGLRASAREALLGHLGLCVGAVFLYSLIEFLLSGIVSGVLSSSDVLSFVLNMALSYLSAVFMGIFQAGISLIFLKRIFGQEASAADLFWGFKESPDRIIRLQAALSAMQLAGLLPIQIYMSFFFQGNALSALDLMRMDQGAFAHFVFTYGGLSLLGTLVQFAVSLFFGLSYYVLLDMPEMTTGQILARSAQLMRGCKGKMFLLVLSFVPLYLLGFLSFGIANLWVTAYEHAAMAAFYRDRIESGQK